MRAKNVRIREGHWHYRFHFHGKEYSGNTGLEGTASNRKHAERYARDEKAKLKAGKAREAEKPFEEAAAEFIVWCQQVEYRGKPNTATRIRSSFSSAVHFFGSDSVQSISAGRLEGYKAHRLEEHGVREISLRHDLHAFSVFFRYAMKMGWANSNPVRQVSIPSDRDAIAEHVVTPTEEEKYFAAAAALHAKHRLTHPAAMPNMANLARLMLDQGARPEELLSAQKDALDLQAGTLAIRGGKSRAARRALDLTAASRAILEKCAQTEGPWLFPSDRHPGHHLTKLSCTHDRICLEAGVSFRVYDWRHTFATRAIESGAPVAVVASIMGHSGLRTIHRYVHPTREAQKLAMERYEASQERRKLKVVG